MEMSEKEYKSSFMKREEEREKRAERFSNQDSSIFCRYESAPLIGVQISEISRMMMAYCNEIGENISSRSIIIDEPSLRIEKTRKAKEALMSYIAEPYSSEQCAAENRALPYILKSAISEITEIQEIEKEIAMGKADSELKEEMKKLLTAYSAFDSFLGEDDRRMVSLKKIAEESCTENFKAMQYDFSALGNFEAYATNSIGDAYRSIAEFIRDDAARNSRAAFSAESKEKVLECEIWCSSHQIRKITSDEAVKSSWNLLLAEYIIEKNGSAMRISPLDREYLDIRFALESGEKNGRG
ncbi:MAG: hypothetical protein NTV63_01305 [Candidatus Woesearchaeota archaeon]|nr:hypothetical protein [Candidatus Woesearchaeota archaeon]